MYEQGAVSTQLLPTSSARCTWVARDEPISCPCGNLTAAADTRRQVAMAQEGGHFDMGIQGALPEKATHRLGPE